LVAFTRAEGIYGDAAKEIKLQLENSPVSSTMNETSITLKVGSTSISVTETGIDIKRQRALSRINSSIANVDITGLLINLNSSA
jgi:hypothetical protein